MDQEVIDRELAWTRLLVLLAAALISFPLLVGAVFDVWNPRAGGDKPFPSYETYKTEMFKNLSERKLLELTGADDTKLHTYYAAAENDHVTAVKTHAERSIVMFGTIFLAATGGLLSGFRFTLR